MARVSGELAAWEKAKAALEHAKADELEKRLAVVAKHFPDHESGTATAELADGRKLKCEIGTEYAVDKEKVAGALDKLRATGNEGTFLADRVIGFSPRLMVGEYKRLEPVYRRIIDKVITQKATTPSLKIEAPKA
jgi:hypothetical protein